MLTSSSHKFSCLCFCRDGIKSIHYHLRVVIQQCKNIFFLSVLHIDRLCLSTIHIPYYPNTNTMVSPFETAKSLGQGHRSGIRIQIRRNMIKLVYSLEHTISKSRKTKLSETSQADPHKTLVMHLWAYPTASWTKQVFV